MPWQIIVIAGFIVAAAVLLAARFLYANLRGSHNTGQKDLRLRAYRAVTRTTTETDCRG